MTHRESRSMDAWEEIRFRSRPRGAPPGAPPLPIGLSRRLVRPFRTVAVVAIAGAAAAGCTDQAPPTVSEVGSPAGHGSVATPAPAANLDEAPLPPIFVEPLTARHQFTDAVAAQLRLKPGGRSREVVNLPDVSNLAVLRITVQPGARFPWHSHPGPVLVAVTQGTLVYVYADDCIERPYPAGTAFVDPGFENVHFARNPTGGETTIVATFLGAPAAGPLTVPVEPAVAETLDERCGVAP